MNNKKSLKKRLNVQSSRSPQIFEPKDRICSIHSNPNSTSVISVRQDRPKSRFFFDDMACASSLRIASTDQTKRYNCSSSPAIIFKSVATGYHCIQCEKSTSQYVFSYGSFVMSFLLCWSLFLWLFPHFCISLRLEILLNLNVAKVPCLLVSWEKVKERNRVCF